MDDNAFNDRRGFVRGNLFLDIKYKVISREEYDKIKEGKDRGQSLQAGINQDIFGFNQGDTENFPNTFLVDFLLHIDKKLNNILEILTKDKGCNEIFSRGKGADISGSGMSLISERLIQPGRIIHAGFLLSRFPPVNVELFGEIVQAVPMDNEDKALYRYGIKFLDLNPEIRELIISFVFQGQREAIRGKKRKEVKGSDS